MSTPSTQQKGIRVWLPLMFALVLIGGMVLGFKLQDTLRTKRSIETTLMRNDRLEELIDLINERYVDSIDANQLYTDAVAGILSHLDPHTTYIPAEELEGENEELEGRFFGIGVEFSIYHDTIYISSVMRNGPAGKVGIEIGDRIIKVGDTLVAGNGITSERIISMLKGNQYTPVVLKILQAVTNRPKTVTIKRDEVPLYSVDASFLLDKNTGYIKLNRFAATTYNEFKRALELLMQSGISQLVLDLRGNPGGYLEAATKIADELIGGDKLLVYTKGLKSDRREQRSMTTGIFEKGKLVVLMDENSASASEILAGAIQDWDRGVILGRPSYGKGLVQQQFDLPDGSAIRLTTARYFTPSGRGIQRSFDKGKQEYYHNYMQRLQAGWKGSSDTGLQLPDTTKYFTSNHRVVYSKGGIMPDVLVTPDTGKITQQVLDIIYSGDFKNAIRNYFLVHREALRKLGNIYQFANEFHAADEVFASYLNTLDVATLKAYQRTLQNPVRKNYLHLQVRAQLAQLLYGDNGYYYMLTMDDKYIKRALSIFTTTEYLPLISGKGV